MKSKFCSIIRVAAVSAAVAFNPMTAFGQLKVQTNGDTYASKNIYIGSSSNFLGTTGSGVPVVFRVNGILAGSTGNTGNNSNTNVSFGYDALSQASFTSEKNNAFGSFALKNNNAGISNSAFGHSTLMSNISGSYNTAIGVDALINNTGGNNTAVGLGALIANTTGSNNTAVGFYAGGSNANNLTNATAIGFIAQNTQSNQVRIGNTSVTSIVGGVNWTGLSDGRAKKNVRAEVPGLAFINLLQPVTYNLDLDAVDEITKPDDPAIIRLTDSLRMARSPEEKEIEAKARAHKEKQVYTGFIAQDVEKAAQSVGYDFSGVDAPENDKSPYGLRYAEFVMPLVKAVQELSEQNNRLQEQINALTARLEELASAPKRENAGVMDASDAAKNFSFSLFPNPTSGFVTVDYSLNVDAPICVELYNMYGQRLKWIVPQQNQKAGTYSVQISVGDLGTGTYIVKVTSGNQVESKQLVVN